MAERKKLADMDILSSLADTDYVTIEHNGAMGRYSFADFKEAVISESEKAMVYDNIMIAHHGPGRMAFATLSDWPALQSQGYAADGVAICSYGQVLIVAPTEADGTMAWAASNVQCDTLFSDTAQARADMDGKGHTEKIIAAMGTDASYAPGYCYAYSQDGIGAGGWWLPSVGELMHVYANLSRVNYALSLVTGATQFQATYYYASSESAANSAYALNMANGGVYNGNKTSGERRVRAVATYNT